MIASRGARVNVYRGIFFLRATSILVAVAACLSCLPAAQGGSDSCQYIISHGVNNSYDAIAESLGITVEALRISNPDKNASSLQLGDVLTVPCSPSGDHQLAPVGYRPARYSNQLAPKSNQLGPSSNQLGPDSYQPAPDSNQLAPDSSWLAPDSSHLAPNGHQLGPSSNQPAPDSNQPQHDSIHIGCFKETYGRGAGAPLHACPADNPEQDGALCYPSCSEGYYGVGPVCWQNCPANFTDVGAACAKPDQYSRGPGYPWKFGDSLGDDSGQYKRCEADHGEGNCKKWGLIVYPKCRSSFHAVGCCLCSPECPAGMKDIGVSCAKDSSGRGASVPLQCDPDSEEQDGALCYSQCRDGYNGVGPLCWQTAGACPAGFPDECGPFCVRSGECGNVEEQLGIQAASALLSAISIASCAVRTFSTFVDAAACWARAIASVITTAANIEQYFATSFGMC